MATYTMTLEKALEYSGGSHELVDGQTVLHGGDIGLNFYPLFDEAYRERLNGLIFDRYRTQEIGTETLSMFQLFMRRRMNEIMPTYNKMYEADLIDVDPLSTVNIKNVSTADSELESVSNSTRSEQSESTSGSETGSGSRNVNSTTPQTMLSGNEDYASSAADSTSTTNVEAEAETTGESVDSGDSATTSHNDNESDTTGYQGHAPELIARYRQTLVSIDMLILEDLKDLFMLTWGNSQPYTY